MDKTEVKRRSQELIADIGDDETFIESLKELLISLIDEKTIKNYKRLIKDTGKYYGVPKPHLWIIAADIRKFILKNPNKAQHILQILWGEGSYEARQIAGKCVEKFGPKHPDTTLEFVESAIPDINNWSICDSLSIYAVEPMLLSDQQPILHLVDRCVKHPNKWIRRFGVISLRGYRKLDFTDEVYVILETVKDDKETDVKKAVSFILRILTPTHQEEVLDILTRWAEQKPDKNTIFIIKDGMKKLPDDDQKKLLATLK